MWLRINVYQKIRRLLLLKKRSLNFHVMSFFIPLLTSCSVAKNEFPANVIDKGDMVLIDGGGFDYFNPVSEKYEHITLLPFFIDKNLVTVKEFDEFVKATGYKTDAERFGNSAVFNFVTKEWELKNGANYLYPFGLDEEKAKPYHPVTQVSWNDANAYAQWKGKRLPSDKEWEYASSNAGTTHTLYTWGNELVENGKYKANTWQGNFPFYNTEEDGYKTTSPVGIFGSNKIGLTDMGGNVWQWTSDSILPTGENRLKDPSIRKSIRGGSFLCDPKVCHGFKVIGLSCSTSETGMVHTGFRCAKTNG
jgi:sulfatase modifying factor 1